MKLQLSLLLDGLFRMSQLAIEPTASVDRNHHRWHLHSQPYRPISIPTVGPTLSAARRCTHHDPDRFFDTDSPKSDIGLASIQRRDQQWRFLSRCFRASIIFFYRGEIGVRMDREAVFCFRLIHGFNGRSVNGQGLACDMFSFLCHHYVVRKEVFLHLLGYTGLDGF